MDWTKHNVKLRMSCETDVQLAEIFGIGRGAVWFWEDDKAIPEGRRWELYARFPKLFPEPEKKAA